MIRKALALTAASAAVLVSGTEAHHSSYHSAKRVIYTVFPPSTERRALAVAGCESNYNRFARNASSGTMGLFQIHPGNIGRRVYWKGHGSIRIPANLYNSWVNSRVALYLSKGGWDWHEWAPVCRR